MTDYLDPRVIGRLQGYELRSLRLVESFMAGMHQSRLMGISTEFAQHRQYVAGDDTKHLDWKVYAKTDRWFVKQYEAETSMQVVFFLDASASMFFRGDSESLSKFDYAATTLSALSWMLLQQKDAFGLVLFDQGVRSFIPPKGSRAHFRNVTDLLEKTTPGATTDLAGALLTVAPQLRRRSLVFVLSDLVADMDRLALGLGQVNFGQHDLAIFHVEDPLERDFPFTRQTVFLGPENEGRLLCDPRDLRQPYLAARRRHLAGVRATCQQFGYDFDEMPTDARLDETLSKFLALRQAQEETAMSLRTKLALAIVGLLVVSLAPLAGQAPPPARDPYKDMYSGYQPDFVRKIEQGSNQGGPYNRWKPDPETMKLSSEPSFFTLTVIDEDSRANALVEAGLKKEQEGQYREALKIYQQVIDKHPQALYRVSPFGVFVPIAQYCQRRILGFPATDLTFYRTLHDAPAREGFEQARRQFSLLGMADVAEKMLATSFGGKAVLELGNAALDSGHYLAALEHFATVRDLFPDPALHTPELAFKIAYCEKMLGTTASKPSAGTAKSLLNPDQLTQLDNAVKAAKRTLPPFHSQLSSAPHVTADDYTLLPPTTDPLGLREPAWKVPLPGSRIEFFVFTQPVITANSVIYRHKNIVYCRSLLNGEPRWINEMGGRATWQDWPERQYPQEDVLVQDGLVFTTINKAGPSLVALDEVTGQLRWAAGPLAAATEEEARMRFEAAPAAGPRTIYAGYVLDNIEGETHTDTEYGVIAFDSRTGRTHWRAPLCRLAPGKFSGGFAEQRRNRIRSFTSPPLYHEGTVYYNTNAGAMVALDSLSGRVKWLMRYPYYPAVHDATREFGEGRGSQQYDPSRVIYTTHRPMFWYNHRPLMVGERLFITPVDGNSLYCLDRRTGKVVWTTTKANTNAAYFLGTTRQGELAIAYTGRNRQIGSTLTTGPVHLLNPANGEVLWKAPDLVVPDDSPLMRHYVFASPTLHWHMNESWFEMTARPTMTSDGRVHLCSFRWVSDLGVRGYVANIGCLDLEKREVVAKRRYYSSEILARSHHDINVGGPQELDLVQKSPFQDEKSKARIAMLKEVVADKLPENDHGPFLPFSRVTCERYTVPFELRISARTVEMVYDREAVQKELANRTGPVADLARAELAMAESRHDDAATLLQKCLETISSEDRDLRAAINQQLYAVYQHLTRRAVRGSRPPEEQAGALGLSRTASTLPEEIQALFAVAESHHRRGDVPAAARVYRTIIASYGQHEYPIVALALADAKEVMDATSGVMDLYKSKVERSLFGKELTSSLALMSKGLPLYQSTVSPLPRTLTVRAGELAAFRLIQLQQAAPEFSKEFQATAEKELAGKSAEEVLERLWEFPATTAAQKALEQQLAETAKAEASAATRQRVWKLADAARVSALRLPDAYRAPVPVPRKETDLGLPLAPREHDFADEEGASRLVLERRDDLAIAPNLLFIGTQLRKRLDNKFAVTALDFATGKIAWETGELRLKGKGNEPGFFEAFVHGDLVVVHGMYDVLAFAWKDGKLRWRYQVPFDFEIRSAALGGDLLILAGKTESVALYVPTDSPVGEVAWQVKELGDLYIAPYVRGDRVISVRKLPFSVTARYRTTGQLIGRLSLPDLSLHTAHPLVQGGPEEVPAVHDREKLVVTDGWYYVMIDTDRLAVLWKRLLDNNDPTREPPIRLALTGDYLAVLKEDFDSKAFYMLSSATGEVLWQTGPKDGATLQPLYSQLVARDRVYGIQPHPGQGFYLVARDATTGKVLLRQEVVGFQGKPDVNLHPHLIGGHLVAQIADRQTFELRVFDAQSGQSVATLQKKGVGPFGIHGRVSATVQNGRLVLLSKDKLSQ